MPHRMMLAPPENVMVQCENLVKIYKTTDVEVMALQGLDLTVERGELMGIVGASGSGKSTLLRCINQLEKADGGEINVDGVNMFHTENGKAVYAPSKTLRDIRLKIKTSAKCTSF